MPSRGRKFITEFLLPSLNEKRFGTRLMWLDMENKIFQVQWNHKSASDWTKSDAAVFAAWDKRKGHYKPNEKEYYSKSKQRFRAALYKFIKLKHITEVNSGDKYTKVFCICDDKNISETHIIIAESGHEKDGNEDGSQKVKQNPEDLVVDWDSNLIFSASLFTVPQENNFTYLDHEMQEKGFIKEEQVVTDNADEFIQDTTDYQNLENYIHTPDSSNNNENFFSVRETSYIKRESEAVNSLHAHFVPETNIYNEDNYLKRAINIERNNCHDYLGSVIDTSRQVEWSDHKFYDMDEDFSSLPLPCIS